MRNFVKKKETGEALAKSRESAWKVVGACLSLPSLLFLLIFFVYSPGDVALRVTVAIIYGVGVLITSITIISKAWENFSAKRKGTKFQSPPGSVLLKIADLLPPKYANDLIQNISDLRREYCDALNQGRLWRAKVITTAYYTGISWTVVKWVINRIKELVGITPSKN